MRPRIRAACQSCTCTWRRHSPSLRMTQQRSLEMDADELLSSSSLEPDVGVFVKHPYAVPAPHARLCAQVPILWTILSYKYRFPVCAGRNDDRIAIQFPGPSSTLLLLLSLVLGLPLIRIRTGFPLTLPTSLTILIFIMTMSLPPTSSFPTSGFPRPAQVRLTVRVTLRARTRITLAVTRFVWLVVYAADFTALLAHPLVVDNVFGPLDSTACASCWRGAT